MKRYDPIPAPGTCFKRAHVFTALHDFTFGGQLILEGSRCWYTETQAFGCLGWKVSDFAPMKLVREAHKQ